jgi:hypothetical protein
MATAARPRGSPGPAAQEGEETGLLVGPRRWLDLGTERPRCAQCVTEAECRLVRPPDIGGIEPLLPTGGTSQVPAVYEQVPDQEAVDGFGEGAAPEEPVVGRGRPLRIGQVGGHRGPRR